MSKAQKEKHQEKKESHAKLANNATVPPGDVNDPPGTITGEKPELIADENAPNVIKSAAETTEEYKLGKAVTAVDPDTGENTTFEKDPAIDVAQVIDGVDTAGDDLAKQLEEQELNEKRPLCEPSKRKGLKKLATYFVTRLNGVQEYCCDEEVGPGSSYTKATPLG